MSGERMNFHNTRKQEGRDLARINKLVPSGSGDLSDRIDRHTTRAENQLSTYEVTKGYLLDNFSSQAKALFAISQSSNPDEQLKAFRQALVRRQQFSANANKVIETGSLTEIEQEHLKLIDGFGITLLDYAAKNLDLFYKRHNITERVPNDPSNVITAEAAQELAELFIRSAKSVEFVNGVPNSRETLLEETVLPLCQKVLKGAMGQERGERVYESLLSGSVGLAAAYHVYSDPSLNRFGKTFLVRLPSPYLDAIEQTDLLLIDTQGMSEEVWQSIKAVLDQRDELQSAALKALAPEAKAYVYKVQVKCRRSQREGLSEQETQEMNSFLRQRCRAQGFDNGDYLVLNFDTARRILEQA